MNDENQPPNDEIQDIEQVKLVYETAGMIHRTIFRINSIECFFSWSYESHASCSY